DRKPLVEKLSDLPKDALLKQVEAQVRQMKANNDDADLLEALLEYWETNAETLTAAAPSLKFFEPPNDWTKRKCSP
ncbi:unnamed protein product, partial [Durusdinium trenchii]